MTSSDFPQGALNEPVKTTFKYVDDNRPYTRKEAAKSIGIAPMTFDRYFQNDFINQKVANNVVRTGKLKLYDGAILNRQIDFYLNS